MRGAMSLGPYVAAPQPKNKPLRLIPPYLYANAMVTYEEPTKLTTMAMTTAQNSRRFPL